MCFVHFVFRFYKANHESHEPHEKEHETEKISSSHVTSLLRGFDFRLSASETTNPHEVTLIHPQGARTISVDTRQEISV